MPGPARSDRRQLLLSGVLLAVAVVVVGLALGIAPGVQTDPLGPRAFPLALGAAIGLCGVLLGATVLAPDRFGHAAPVFVEGGEGDSPAGAFAPGRLVAAVVLTVAYVAAFEPLGYEAKKMVPMAVASDKRSPIFPDVPTLTEKGADVVMVQWRSVLAPRGTPAPRVAALAEAFQKALNAESWKAFNRNSKAVAAFLGPADFRAFLTAEEARFARIVEQLGLRKK